MTTLVKEISGLTYDDFRTIEGYFLSDECAKDLLISDFEYQGHYTKRSTSTNLGFIAFTKDRRSEINGREVAWPDGNQEAIENIDHISLLVTEHPIEELKETLPQFIVENTWKFMLALSQKIRSANTAKVIAITGSVGKSSTRLMVDQLLQPSHDILSNRGNHNTRFAIPLYLCKASQGPEILNLEVSLNALNNRDSGPMSPLIQPDIALVTSVGEAHMATFKSIEQLAEYKGRVYDGLSANGIAIINRDIHDHLYQILLAKAQKKTNRIRTYSMTDPDADLYLVKKSELKHGVEITISLNEKRYTYFLNISSKGMVENSLAALLIIDSLGIPITQCTKNFAQYRSLPKILEETHYSCQNKEITVLDDTHNASIPAMINAIEAFKQKHVYYGGKKILVLGQIADLGSQAETLHQTLLPWINESGADLLLGYGPLMQAVTEQCQLESAWFDNLQDLVQKIKHEMTDQSFILLKGSVSHSDFHQISGLLKRSLRETVRNS
ncbi:UDP-N-acetylmuramoyl-tripeptide--D-alanyl-D-alanine ligase [Enterococcus sp. DIV0876]|uniref:UDP-N-acetylmuramoyl-tripeptide--D-alanyl-D- alanine ligase n=1 Tax=Enterococcus sp. DIV0876 TaxID=2774633 RepID=UPI003D2FB894